MSSNETENHQEIPSNLDIINHNGRNNLVHFYTCLYTNQKTKKSKVWRDGICTCRWSHGFIRSTLCSLDGDSTSMNNLTTIDTYQIILVESPTSLCGKCIEFPGYLVEITDLLPYDLQHGKLNTLPSDCGDLPTDSTRQRTTKSIKCRHGMRKIKQPLLHYNAGKNFKNSSVNIPTQHSIILREFLMSTPHLKKSLSKKVNTDVWVSCFIFSHPECKNYILYDKSKLKILEEDDLDIICNKKFYLDEMNLVVDLRYYTVKITLSAGDFFNSIKSATIESAEDLCDEQLEPKESCIVKKKFSNLLPQKNCKNEGSQYEMNKVKIRYSKIFDYESIQDGILKEQSCVKNETYNHYSDIITNKFHNGMREFSQGKDNIDNHLGLEYYLGNYDFHCLKDPFRQNIDVLKIYPRRNFRRISCSCDSNIS